MRKILKAANNAVKTALIAAIKFYRRFLSPLKPRPTCIFYPTCSGYAVEAIEKRGIFIGLCLAAWRLLRCNPFNNHGGWDPVPLKKPGKSESDGSVRKKTRDKNGTGA